MITTTELIAAAKAGAGIPSNYRLARVLGVTDQAVYTWQRGSNAPDDKTCLRLAEMAGLDGGAVLAAMHAARAKDEATAAVWAQVAARLAGTAAALVVTVMASVLFWTPAPASAGTFPGATARFDAVQPAFDRSHHWRGFALAASLVLMAWALQARSALPIW